MLPTAAPIGVLRSWLMGRRQVRMRGRRGWTWAALAAVLLAAGVFAAWRWTPPSTAGDAGLHDGVVRFEQALASIRPSELVGTSLTAADRESLQMAYVARLEDAAAGDALKKWRDWDYAKALLQDEDGGVQITGCTEKVVYWDFLRREVDGDVAVHAGVEERFHRVKWDANAQRAVPQPDWVAGVTVWEYTLRKTDANWRVVERTHWRFYDPATDTLNTGP